MRQLTAILILPIALAACGPSGESNNANNMSCNDANATSPRVIDTNTIIKSHVADLNVTHPLDIGMELNVILEGVESYEIADAFVQYPNGDIAEGSHVAFSNSVGSTVNLYNNFFLNYSETNGLRLVPMTGYCVEVTLTNGEVIASTFDLERSDGTSPTTNEMFVHADDYDSISGGGDFSKGMDIPVITAATISLTELEFTMTINDNRAVEYLVIVSGNGTDVRGEYFTDDASAITNDGSQTYTIDIADLDTSKTSTELVAGVDYVFVIIYDAGYSGTIHDPKLSEISALSRAFHF
jgi:hypothetical protein